MTRSVGRSRWRDVLGAVGSTRRGRLRPGTPRLVGGLALTRDKPGLDTPIVDVPLPALLVLPLVGYRARALVPQVAVGQDVARGELLAPGLPASAAGTVVAIEPRPVAHPAGREAPCIVLETRATSFGPGAGTGAADGRGDGSVTFAALRPTLPGLDALTIERLVACGVGGLGGAGFPTPDKLADAMGSGVHTLVVNGAECEPGIACDEALMAVAADEIVAGGVALAALAGARRCLVVVESDKRVARTALLEAVHALAGPIAAGIGPDAPELRLIDIAPLYPSGAERLLLRLATGIDVPPGARPARHGLLCVNVATARAAHRARLGEPALARIVTVAGGRARRPCNARVAFGTPLADVLDATGQEARAGDTRRRVGGPLSGFDVASECVPITAAINRIALEPPQEAPAPAPCIRCAACSDVCPVDLLPQELLRHARAGADAALDRGGLDACLECGCCDIVCPSSIELTATFRHARGARLDARARARDTARAEALHRRRETRLAARAEAPPPTRAVPVPTASPARGGLVDTDMPSDPERRDAPVPTLRAREPAAGVTSDTASEAVAAALARARRRRGGRDGGDRA